MPEQYVCRTTCRHEASRWPPECKSRAWAAGGAKECARKKGKCDCARVSSPTLFSSRRPPVVPSFLRSLVAAAHQPNHPQAQQTTAQHSPISPACPPLLSLALHPFLASSLPILSSASFFSSILFALCAIPSSLASLFYLHCITNCLTPFCTVSINTAAASQMHNRHFPPPNPH